MKKILLITVALLGAGAASAQMRVSDQVVRPVFEDQIVLQKDVFKVETAQMRDLNTPVVKKAPKRLVLEDEASYRRPAGAFMGNRVFSGGKFAGSYAIPRMFVKPYAKHTFVNLTPFADATYQWNYSLWNQATQADQTNEATTTDLEVEYGFEAQYVPTLTAKAGSVTSEFALPAYTYAADGATPGDMLLYAVPSFLSANNNGYEMMLSSHYFGNSDRYGVEEYGGTYYSGATAPEGQENGWWFGTNADGIDGIAAAFEAPEQPYVLKNVVVPMAMLTVTEEAKLTCRVYRLEEIPAYIEDNAVQLPEEPGELIASSEITIGPDYAEEYRNAPVFSFKESFEGIEFEVTPEIDFPILVCIDGYNMPDNPGIKELSATISTDEYDEGFGELAYLKYKFSDGSYRWIGLNNFFTSGQMKVGLSVFIVTENPYMVFNYSREDGEYKFPDEGGKMDRTWVFSDTTMVMDHIEIYSSKSSEEYFLLTESNEDLPEWLSIELVDGTNTEGEFSGIVNAIPVAQPLPEGTAYRECVVKFAVTGANLTYKFTQGVKGDDPDPIKGDVNGDGKVEIDDVNALINILLGKAEATAAANVDGVGGIDVQDVNVLINIILGK